VGVIGTLGYVGEERKDQLEHLDTQPVTSSYREKHGQRHAEDGEGSEYSDGTNQNTC
jgi:hypothetical protein